MLGGSFLRIEYGDPILSRNEPSAMEARRERSDYLLRE
jgi:hypothetical protein